MATEDADGDPVRRPVPDPLDRVWRHPSELTPVPREPERAPGTAGPNRGWSALLAAGLVGAVLTVGALGFAGMLGRSDDRTEPVGAPDTGAPSTARIVAAASPGVVSVTAWFGEERRRASGVGVTPGYVITDAASVAGATTLGVAAPGASPVPAKLVALDPDTGLALVAADLVVPVMPTAPEPAVGEPVVALAAQDGGPLVSTGVVSSVDHLARGTDGTVRAGLIGTDAGLGAGAPGGMLLDAEGRLVGVLTAQQGSADAVAVPSSTMARVAGALRTLGHLDRGWMGLKATAVRAGAGVTVVEVSSGGPADRAGITVGDVVTAVDGVPVSEPADLSALVRCHVPGERATLDLRRDDRSLRLEVVLSGAPGPPATAASGSGGDAGAPGGR